MKTTKLFADGHELLIEMRIGKGGEGEVFAVSNMPGFAVKAYLPGLVADREAKIRAMVAARLADKAPMVAYPNQVVVDGRGVFVGFVMRLVEKHKEIHELQTPSSRQKHFPKADYAFMVRAAINIARVFAQVHASGCVVGDVNQRGILVSSNATVALIDADSFQVSDGAQRYLCVVGVPEYTPPELQGRSLKSVLRTNEHDAFGLAVCLFQLLCMDRHPFSGRFIGNGDMPLEKAIADYRFAYSARNTGMVPPPGTVRLSDFTPKVAQLFEDAFSPNHIGRRPSASMWVEALRELEVSLRVCSRIKLHRYSRAAGECPWCRMEAEYGRPLFIDADISSIHVPNGRLDQTAGLVLDIPTLMAAINSVALPSWISVALPHVPGSPPPSQAAKDAQSQKWSGPAAKIAGLGVLFGAAVAFVSGVPGIIAFGIAALGAWLLFHSSSPANGLLSAHRLHASAVSARIEQLQRNAPVDAALRKRSEALTAIDEFKELAAAFGNIRSEYDKHRRQKQLDSHLLQYPIRGAHIAKVNSGDVAQLASYGFATAFDARQRDVTQVHGIGPVKATNIASWIRRVEAGFQFHSAYTSEDQQNIQKAQNAIVAKQQGLEEKIRKSIDEFRQEAQTFERWKTTHDPELARLIEKLVQAEVDLQHVGIPVPSRPNVAPRQVQPNSVIQPTKRSASFAATSSGVARPSPASATAQQSATACPRCGSGMVRRLARRGTRAGKAFWGCSRYPTCSGTRPI